MTNHMVEKAVTALQAKRPVEPERLPVGPPGATATLVVEREKPQTRSITTLLAYFAALRLILGTYAYCGTHWVESFEEKGKMVEFFPWEVALGYVDDCMHKVLEVMMPDVAKLAWLRMRDERTRAQMAHLINEGMPGGEALRAAWKSHAHLWDMQDHTIAAEALGDYDMDTTYSPSSSHQQGPRSAPNKRKVQMEQPSANLRG